MQFSEQDLNEVVAQATQDLKVQLQRDLVSRMSSTIETTAREMVKNHVETWVAENVLPDVTLVLLEGKQSLVQAAVLASEGIAQEISKHMVEATVKNLKKSWTRKKIFEALFQD